MLATAMLLAGGSACGKQGDTARPYSVEMVRAVFEKETGDELITERSNARNPVLGVDVTLLGVAPRLDARYGDFGITVWAAPLGDGKRRLLYGGRKPDEKGIISTRRTMCLCGRLQSGMGMSGSSGSTRRERRTVSGTGSTVP